MSKLFCGYWQTDSEVYMEMQKTHNNQHNIEREEQYQKTNFKNYHEELTNFKNYHKATETNTR